MNILMICHKGPDGAYARSHAMGRELVAGGHHVTLVMVSDRSAWKIEETDWDGVRAVETPTLLPGRLKYGWDAWNLLSRILFLRRERTAYDLVHCFETRPASIYPALWLARRVRIPLLTDWNDWFGRNGLSETNRPDWYRALRLSWIETYYEEKFPPLADGVTVISTALGERAHALGVPEDRICWIPGGAFPDLFLPRSREECRRHVGMRQGIPILGYGSSDSHFDLEIVMAALAIVAMSYPEVRLIVTGKPKESVYRIARDYGVLDRIDFAGYVAYEELPWVLGCADVFLAPISDRPCNVGRWPNKLGEYASLGRPTVSNPVGDVTDFFTRYHVGALAKWDAQDFARRIMRFLGDPNLSARVGRAARHTAETEISWRCLTRRLEEFYGTVLRQAALNGRVAREPKEHGYAG